VERESTRRGGVLLLLKALHWLDWPAAWRRAMPDSMPGEECDSLARALALVVAARALDPRGAAGSMDDAALRLAFRVDEPQRRLREGRHAVAKALGPSARGGSPQRASERLLAQFAARVPGLAGSSARYLRQNALALSATVERDARSCRVRLGRAPLDVLLVIAGCKRGAIELPGGVAVELREDRGE
jgi:hypothetical protein